MINSSFLYLRENILFKSCSDADLQILAKTTREIRLQPGEYLIKEGDYSNELYIIAEGTLEVTKQSFESTEHIIALLHSGDTVGEMPLLDNAPRAMSVRAKSTTLLFAMSFSTIRSLAKARKNFRKIFEVISKKVNVRLRNTNELAFNALEKQVNEYKKRVLMANFIVCIIIFLCFYILIETKLSIIISHAKSTSEVAAFTVTVFLIFILILLKVAKISLKDCGVTLHNWRRSVSEGILFSIPILLIILLIKFALLHLDVHFIGKHLFDPYLNFRGFTPEANLFSTWFSSILVYSLLSAPLQELIARGALQTALESFLVNKNKKWSAIIISNVIFSSFHAAASIYLVIIVFIPGIFWGWLYARHRTLIGVWISHTLIGVWSVAIVGLWART